MRQVRDPNIIEGYLTDASNTRGHAEVLVLPRSTEEVAEILRHCQAESLPVTVTAKRTSTTGGPVPHGGWLLSTEKLDTIESLNQVQAGCYLGAYQEYVEAEGWFFPPDPTSRHECSIGAAIACNASGARSFRYGPARPWIEWIEMVLPTGEILEADRNTPIPEHWPVPRWTEPEVKTAAGFFPADNLLDLFIGQEGSLGVITRVRTRLIRPPEDVMSLVAFFPDLHTCLQFVDKARRDARRPGSDEGSGSLSPRAIEFFDHHALAMIRARMPDIPDDAQAALFIEVEHPADEPPIDEWCDALEASTPLADDTILTTEPSGRQRLHTLRHAVPAGVNEVVVANQMPKVGTDFSVPDEALADMMNAYAAVPLPHILFGHIGDNHLHLNLLPRSQDELVQARRLYRELALMAVDRGGSVSAEHGIGKIKRGLLAEMVGPETIRDFCALKRTLDPAWVLGRGTLLESPSG
jgi:D-lactate dehydrogenase (cytochrome)